jgi:hypothetical protein
MRELTFGEGAIAVRDRIVAGEGIRIRSLWRPRAFTAVHMGSARYYHPRDLIDLPEPDLADAAAQLSRAGQVELAFSVRLAGGAAVDGHD